MKYILIALFLMLGACAKNGSDGSPGVSGASGSNGIDGTNGVDGIAGVDGTNGTDNKIIKTYNCIGAPIAAGSWSVMNISYAVSVMTSGDMFVSLIVYGLQDFNVSTSKFYSYGQDGAADGTAAVMIDNNNAIYVKFNAQDKLIVEMVGTIDPGVYTDTLTCMIAEY